MEFQDPNNPERKPRPKNYEEITGKFSDHLKEIHPALKDQFKGKGSYPTKGYKFIYIKDTVSGDYGIMAVILFGIHKKTRVLFMSDHEVQNFENETDYVQLAVDNQIAVFVPSDSELEEIKEHLWNVDQSLYKHYLKNREINGIR